MRRIVLWAASTVSALVLLLGYHTSLSSTTAAGSTQTPYTSTGPSATSGTTSGHTDRSAGSAGGNDGGAGGAGGKNGGTSSAPAAPAARKVTGNVVQTAWGPVQVQLTLKGATITSVSVLQYPSGNANDTQINAYALPILIKETTQQQSAHIDMVSGATYTSTGYIQSLQSALDKA